MNAIKRREKKYLLNKEQYQSLINEISNKIVEDKYGLQTIRNIYFDNDYYQVIRTSLEKPKFKEKLRLRCYGLPDDQSDVFLEIKKKYKKVVYKRRLNLKLIDFEHLMTNLQKNDFVFNANTPCVGELTKSQLRILDEVVYKIKKYRLYPKIFIAYDRIAYNVPSWNNFRITFDNNIRSKRDNLSLRIDSDCKFLIGSDNYIMEAKVMNSFPLWFVKALSKLKIYPISFSKYGKIFQNEFNNIY